MNRPRHLIPWLSGCLLLALVGAAQAQFASSGTTSLSVAIPPEAALQINTSTTTLSSAGATFNLNFTGTTNFTFKIRTTKTGGTGTINLKVTSDFSPAGGPSVLTPPTAGDALAYTCSLTGLGTACSGSQTASTTSSTPVGAFGANAMTPSAGDSGSVSWTLTDDPQYSTGTYTATVTFSISAA
jgi:hypothetical protein